jgi:uncharacterized membrane protein (UPF0127 family)
MLAVIVVLVIPAHSSRPGKILLLGERRFHMLVATTEEEQHKGLGGRESLGKDEGMLFVFDQPGVQCFWMKGMQFPLDIIWLDAGKRVVHIESNVLPASFPESFCPPTKTQYVIELNAGEVKQNRINVGQKLAF